MLMILNASVLHKKEIYSSILGEKENQSIIIGLVFGKRIRLCAYSQFGSPLFKRVRFTNKD